MESVLRPVERYPESEDTYYSNHRRSVSCSSPIHSHSMTPERYMRTKRGDRATHATENLDSPSSSRAYHCSSGNSPCSSPILLKCRAARLQRILKSDNTLDLYIDGEHQNIKPTKDSQKYFSDSGDDGCLAENRVLRYLGRPPRALSTAPSSPTHSKEHLRTYSFREVKDTHRLHFRQDQTNDDLSPTSPQKHTEKNFEKFMYGFHGKPMMESRDYDSETTTIIEDIYEDSSDPQRTLNSPGIAQQYFTGVPTACEDINGSFREEPSSFHRKSCFLGNDKLASYGLQKQNTDEELLEKAKEVEHMLMILSDEDLVLKELRNSSLTVSELLRTTRKISEDRRSLALELSSQIKCRIAERSFTREGLKEAKLELYNRSRRLEREKNELQSSLEKELDRRSSDWSLKLGKFQSEEQRLRERVTELAEQNVSLQREITLLKGSDVDTRSRIMDSEMQLNDLKASLEEVRTENHRLRQAFSKLEEHLIGAEEDRDCIRRSYKEKEKECKELQKVVVRLQRICNEQEKTIDGLRLGCSNEIGKLSLEREDSLSRFQVEQIRLTGVEQMLRKEVESCRHEVESLRHENMCLLDRLQSIGDGCGFSSVKLDQELRARLDCLQTQGLSLLNDDSRLFGELLDLIKRKQSEYGEEAKIDLDDYSVVEYTVKHQSLRRGIENFSRSLQTLPAILDEKSNLEAMEWQLKTTQCDGLRQSKGQASEDNLEFELKAETMLTRVLRETLCSKELELEQLQSDLASSVRAQDVLQSEIKRLQDELSCHNHKTKDMELQMLRKDERINQLQHDFQECTKERTAIRNILMKVSEERDSMWDEVKCSRETSMLLNLEVTSLKKKIEALDEDVLIKEGEIAILKDSLADKAFDTIYSPEAVKKFAIE